MAPTLEKVIVWGASGHALVVADILRLMGDFAIVGYLDSVSPHREGESFGGAVITGGQEELEELIRSGVSNLALGVGDCESDASRSVRSISVSSANCDST